MQLTYKAFPLGPTPDMAGEFFGTPEAAKAEILSHWEATRRYGHEPRINVELMRRRDFPYPYSMPALMAVKAAEFQAGQPGHAGYFDRAQQAHLVECRNVADRLVLLGLAEELGLDMGRFREDFESDGARQAVLADHQEALARGIRGTPTVVFSGRWLLSGAVPVEDYRRVVEDLLAGQPPGNLQVRVVHGYH